jgi:hypothetical protein
LELGSYETFNGDKRPVFFTGLQVPIGLLTLNARPIDESINFQRVQRLLQHYPSPPIEEIVLSRDPMRTFVLVKAMWAAAGFSDSGIG